MLEFFEPPHKINRFIFVLQLLLNLLDVLPEHLRVILEQGIHAVGHNRTDDEDRDDDVKCHEKLHPLSAHGDVSVANGGDDLDDHVNRGQRAPSLVIPTFLAIFSGVHTHALNEPNVTRAERIINAETRRYHYKDCQKYLKDYLHGGPAV